MIAIWILFYYNDVSMLLASFSSCKWELFVLRLLLVNGPRVRKQINCANMQKLTQQK